MDSAVVAFRGATNRTFKVDLVVRSGDLVIVQPDDESHEQALVDAVCGLTGPRAGAVRFLGLDWSAVPPDHANAMRGRMGHVFRRGQWLPYLSVADNILLRPMHHTRRSYEGVRDEAARLAILFGLPGIPVDLPNEFSDLDRRRAAFVRAFLGRPDLVILESSNGDELLEIIEPLLSAIRQCQYRNGAVLWFVLDRRLWMDSSLQATQRFRLRGNDFLPVDSVA
jgi:phospholipid/cholesterol/gamma-HCH transport system ATP-binding protein